MGETLKSFDTLRAEFDRLRDCGIDPGELRLGAAWFDWAGVRYPAGRILNMPVVYDPTEKEFRFV